MRLPVFFYRDIAFFAIQETRLFPSQTNQRKRRGFRNTVLKFKHFSFQIG